MLAEARRAREAGGGIAGELYRREVAAREARIAEARERGEKARAERDLLSRLRWGLIAWWRRLGRRPRRPTALAPSHGEEAIKGGIKGEREVADVLRGALGDTWTLIKGYRNRRGEIDYLLLGPGGMFAIEVKYVNGTFAVTREHWRYVRYDNYGNQVGEGLLQDARRRPPNVQLAEPLALLEQFLASRGHQVRSARWSCSTTRRPGSPGLTRTSGRRSSPRPRSCAISSARRRGSSPRGRSPRLSG